MKIVFVSNYYNHHQSSLCEVFDRKTNHQFHFIETTQMREERKKLGYVMKSVPDYVVKAYADDNTKELCKQLIQKADIVIIGSAPNEMIKERIKSGKIVFRYSERPLKNGFSYIKYIPRLFKWHMQSPFYKPIYMLCASAYTAGDYRRFGLFKNKCYKWGYFPETKKYDSVETLLGNKEANSIIWIGRFLQWKHPEQIVYLGKELKRQGYNFTIKVIGTGVLENTIKSMIHENHLEENVFLLGAMQPEQVRKHMEKSQIHIFTSDRNEGWGAVLNESMNSACAVVANNEIGAVPFLINNEKNGLIYESGNNAQLVEKVIYLLENEEYIKKLGTEAYKTIVELWNAEIASDRLLKLANSIMNNGSKSDLYYAGPCSIAETTYE